MTVLRFIYRALLYACPSGTRRRYGPEMEDTFVHCLSVEWARRGVFGRIAAVARGCADVVSFILRVRFDQVLQLPAAAGHQSRFSRLVMTRIARDIGAALRLTHRQPVFAAAVVGMLALGIGASTALFSVVHGVLFEPLPFAEPDCVVQVVGTMPARQMYEISLSAANFWDLHDRNRTFAQFGAWHGASFSLTGFDAAERLRGAMVSVGFFSSLGINPVAGRLFEPGEDDPGAPDDHVLISHGLWTRHFARAPSTVGRTITLDGRPFLMIGVLPPGTPWLDNADVFVPFVRQRDANRSSWEYAVVGRLKPGVAAGAALDDLGRIARELEAAYPENKGLGVRLIPSRTWMASDDLRRVLWVLFGSVALLLAIASVNATNLLLVRSAERAHEIAIRTALGASRADLMRERLVESTLYSLAAMACGLLIAVGMLTLLKAVDPGDIPRLNEVAVNRLAFAFATATAIAVGIATGLLPAIHAPRAQPLPALQRGGRGTAGSPAQRRLRSAFVTVEVAISLILLVGAGLLVRSFASVLSVDRGFQSANRLLATITLPRSYGETRIRQTTADILARLRNQPEILAVASVSGRPLARGSTGLGIVASDQPDAFGGAVPWATWRIVTPDYFKAMGLPLLAGRTVTEQAAAGPPREIVVSRRLAALLWPGRTAVGQTAILWKGQADARAQVIGVVGDMRERGLEEDPTLAVYLPESGGRTTLQLVLHTRSRPEGVAPAVRAAVASIDRNLPVSNIQTVESVVTDSLATRRLTLELLATFAGLALVLALAGVYGVLAYSMARRTSEIGVRVALGAGRRQVLQLVLSQGMRPVVAGLAIGMPAALAVSQLMASLLFDITPHDPATYLIVVAAMAGVSLLACVLPAQGALRVDAAAALRIE